MKTGIPPVLITIALVCFALDQNTQAVSPPPLGGYPNFTSAAGDHALRKVEEQQATITQLKQDFQSRLAHQQKQIEALTAGLQKVSAQVEANKPAPQVVNNP
jgi:Skp family chaperone for outer membrane proteins